MKILIIKECHQCHPRIYSCFSYKFTFSRAILQHMLVTFIPTILIVMLSWISFWLNVDLAAPRVALGQTSLLTLAAQFNSLQNNLPPASNVKAIDIWMFVCIFMSFASILEYALAVNYKKLPLQQQSRQRSKIGLYNHNRKVKLFFEKNKEICAQTRSVDSWAKIIFPFELLACAAVLTVNQRFGFLSPVSVAWSLQIKGILKLSAKDMEFSVDVELITFWQDNQLQTSHTKTDEFKILPKEITNKLYKKKINFNCIFDLSLYPFDVQICHMDVMQNICFSYTFEFERTILQNVLLIFLPSFLIVMLSWISFWLDVDLAAPRVALGQTSLLTLAAQFNSVQHSLPPVSTVKAIDVWMFTCILMAFASILEYAVAYNCKKRQPHYNNKVVPYRKVVCACQLYLRNVINRY
uniref:Neurotransmitter-gated ion-channel transmembrane domain-containing protein n=1 Tax=Strigamia maritima TaxID=126957 RepID=T1JD85_STRMM